MSARNERWIAWCVRCQVEVRGTFYDVSKWAREHDEAGVCDGDVTFATEAK